MVSRRRWPNSYAVDKLVAHRWTQNGFEFKVKWSGTKRNGMPWEDSWENVKDVGEPLVNSYFSRIEQCEVKIVENVNISPLVNQAREKVAHATACARTKCRPRVHQLPLEALSLQPLAMAFLEVVRRPAAMSKLMGCGEEELTKVSASGDELPIGHHVDPQDGVHTWEVHYTSIKDVAAFCAFHSFMGCREGVGALRYSIGRASNEDCMVVGVPMAFKVSANRGDGLVTTELMFATCWINGKFGTMTPPPQTKGMLRKAKHFSRVLEYAKECLPSTHPLAAKGWKSLPYGVHTLPSNIAVPANSSDDDM